MSVFKWDKSFSVGVEMIDNEHKKLIDMANEYYKVYIATQSKDLKNLALKELVAKLVEYTLFHLSHEEEILEKCEYTNLAPHRERHQEFRKKVIEMKNDLDEGKTVYSMEITNFIRYWLVSHINLEDKKYTKCLHDNNIH